MTATKPAAPILTDDNNMLVPRNLMQKISHALHCADVLVDAIPTRLQNHNDSAIAHIGQLVNEDGVYRVIADTKRELYEFLAAPVAIAPQESKPTQISARLRRIASEDASPYFCTNVPKDDLRAASDEIERYYGGMLAWKATAEAEDRAPVPAPSEELIRDCIKSVSIGHIAHAHLTDTQHCAECRVNLDDGDGHLPDCLTIRARAYLAATLPLAEPVTQQEQK